MEAIRENISDYWGIHDRKSLMKTTDSLLQKGDKYTYAQTLEKLGEEALTLPEDSIYYTYKLYAPDEMCKYLGTYYAYNNIGDAGVDAWDYCRCIRLFPFGYICGYISYDEYLIHAAPLAVYLQNEYDSWETMYESYYYGYLIFAGRNKNSSSSVIYSDYRYYEIMADKTEIPFRTEEIISQREYRSIIMKIGIISDIHSNIYAFKACTEYMEKHKCDEYFFLGDYISDTPYTRETMDYLYEFMENHTLYLLRGNREEYMLTQQEARKRKCTEQMWISNSASGNLTLHLRAACG